MKLKYSGRITFSKIAFQTFIKSVFIKRERMINETVEYFNSKLANKNKVSAIVSSGRAAISLIVLRKRPEKVYIPEYICNAVQMAADKYSSIDVYKIDANYRFDLLEVVEYSSKNKNCCVILPSFLSRKYDIKSAIKAIRTANNKCIIILDECQNLMDISTLPYLGENVYAVFSFNNKSTYGFLGGMIVQASDSADLLSNVLLPVPSMKDEWHARYTFVYSYVKDMVTRNKFSVPLGVEVSQCKDIYSVLPKQPLKISIAAASLISKYWDWYEKCLSENRDLINSLANENLLNIISGFDDCNMPYVPVLFDKELIGSIPLKSPYGCKSDSSNQRECCFVLHNSLILRRNDK